jgi:trehalose utilization protein
MNIIVFSEINASMLTEEGVKAYPETLGVCLKNLFEEDGNNVTLVKLDENGAEDFNQDALNTADVAVWWAHWYHGKVQDELVDKITERVQKGMGLICLHSAHKSKVFMRLTGCTGNLKWREVGEQERLWCVNINHPINDGLGEYVDIEHEEMYGEPFDIPTPDELVYLGWFEGGEVLRAGCVFNRGRGKMFYLNAGHETYPVYRNEGVRKIIINASKYVKPNRPILEEYACEHVIEFSVKK